LGKAAHAGGVATSGLEMSQNSMRLNWSREEVDGRLREIMRNIHRNCSETAELDGAPGPYTVIGTTAGTASYTDATASNGTTYYYLVSANNTAGESSDSNQAGATPNTSYGAWAASPAQGLTAGVNDGPLDDPDHDGIANLLEFVLGGAPMVSSRTLLPKLTRTGGSWFYEYDRSDLSQAPATTQEVEYGNDLSGWTAVTIPPTGAGPVAITPGSPTDHVKVAIPDPGANGFVRLKVTRPN
jgi:hypothetical protein